MKTTLANQPLAQVLDEYTKPAADQLWRAEENRIRCLACGHRCLIGEGQRGICKVRFERDGQLMVPFGYVSGLQSDPVEKKPFFHVYPGSDALTFGMMGCDLHCSYCQNWLTSQALRDPSAVAPIRPVAPSELVQIAKREGSRLVVSSYNEPLITSEWAVAVFREASAAGLACAFVSNGNATPEVLDFLRPWIVAYKVDLKSFNDRNYRKLGGTLDNITTTIGMVHERGIWLEIVTLVVPGFNDTAHELRQIAKFLASISRDIPWHVTAFHKDYRMTDPEPTTVEALVQAAEIGTQEGLRYVYAGNLPGRAGQWENTRCPTCRATLIERFGYLVRSYNVQADGSCPHCQTRLPGVWPRAGGEVKTGNDQRAYLSRLPRPVAMKAATVGPVSNLQDRRQGLPIVQENKSTIHEGIQPMAAPSTIQRPPATERPTLSDPQKKQLVNATAALLKKLVLGESASLDANLQPQQLMVWGSFVSLKRGRHLRGCSGVIGQTLPMHMAVSRAAERTVWEDERFPPVSPTELEHLQLEVWLLFDPQPVPVRGEARAKVITLGKHGIQVNRGQSGALFLPSVALENEWDAFTFLDRVCLKAGLPASAWREDDTALFTFEGTVVRAPIKDLGTPVTLPAYLGPGRAEDLAKLVNLCRVNLTDVLTGAVPHMFAGAPDGTFTGVVLSVQKPGTNEMQSFTRFQLRQGLPLHSTLLGLVQPAAQFLATQKLTAQTLSTLPVGLTLLHDPTLHGTVADPHLAGFDPRRRAILVFERNKAGMAFAGGLAAEEVLQAAAKQARVGQPEAAAVYSLTTTTNLERVEFSTAPKPVRGPAERAPAVAGKFYEGDPAKLAMTVSKLMAGCKERPQQPWPAAMVPHAGLIYSGQIAAAVLKRIAIPKTVIIIGPNHTGQGMEWAVAPHQNWVLPGATMASDFILARRLSQAIAGLEMDAVAHQHEHGIEVELPLLARLAPESKVVGITISHGDLDGCRRFAQGLAEVIRGREDQPLLLISSDMNHFATDAETRRLDGLALAALDRGDAEELYETVTSNNISMCGMLPAVIVLETLKLLGGFKKAERVGYATTGDVTGDRSRVVGYAGMLLG